MNKHNCIGELVLLVILTASCAMHSQSPSTPDVFTPGPVSTPVLLPTVVEPGLAYGEPCIPPCWREIIPGESTAQETEQAMEKLRTSGWAYSVEGDHRGYVIKPTSSIRGTILVSIENNVVTKIMGNPLFDYEVGTLVDLVGSGPEYMYFVGGTGGGCPSCEEWEPSTTTLYRGVNVHLFYPSQGLWFLLKMPRDGRGCLCPEMKIISFCYFAPISEDKALQGDYLDKAMECGAILSDVDQEDIVEWHGFGGGY